MAPSWGAIFVSGVWQTSVVPGSPARSARAASYQLAILVADPVNTVSLEYAERFVEGPVVAPAACPQVAMVDVGFSLVQRAGCGCGRSAEGIGACCVLVRPPLRGGRVEGCTEQRTHHQDCRGMDFHVGSVLWQQLGICLACLTLSFRTVRFPPRNSTKKKGHSSSAAPLQLPPTEKTISRCDVRSTPRAREAPCPRHRSRPHPDPAPPPLATPLRAAGGVPAGRTD